MSGTIHPTRIAGRLGLVWARMPVSDRRVVCELGGLVPAIASATFDSLQDPHRLAIVAGMRRLVSLSQECRFALGYARAPRAGEGT